MVYYSLPWHRTSLSNHNPRIFVFLHSAKSGGSSLWHSLAEEAAKCKDIKYHVLGTHNTSIKLYGKPDRQFDAAAHLLRDFQDGKHKGDILMHYHGPGEGIDTIFPASIKPTYILLLRDSLRRLRSAFKWYMITEVKQSYTDDTFTLDNFFNVFLSHGYDRILPAVLGWDSVSQVNVSKDKNRFLPVSLDDFNTKGPSFAALCNSLGIELFDSIVYKETVTGSKDLKPEFPPENNMSFWKQFNDFAASEEAANNLLLPKIIINVP